MRWILLMLMTMGWLAAEDISYAQHLREILARYANARVPPPPALVAAIADPPPDVVANGTAASEQLYQARECLDALTNLTLAAELLPAARIAVLATYFRQQADAAVAQSIALHPGPTAIPREVIARRSPLQAISLVLFVQRSLRNWQQPGLHQPASPLRAEAEQRLRRIATLADQESAKPWPNPALHALQSAAWGATNAGNWQPLQVEGDEALATAFHDVQRRPHLAALTAIDALLDDPTRSAPPPSTYAMQQVAGSGHAVVGKWGEAHRDLQAITADLAVLPPTQTWLDQVAALTTELHALRDRTIAALQTGDLGALQAEAGSAIDLAGVVASLRETVTQERAFAERLVERREAFAHEEPAQRLAAALAEWRAAQTVAAEAKRRVTAVERRISDLDTAVSPFPALHAESVAAHLALEECLRQLAKPAPVTPGGE